MVYLISEDILKSEGLIDDNLWGGYIGPSIQLAQDKGLQPAIGGPLYDKICSMVADGTIKNPANAAYKVLLDDYITPYLTYQVLVEVIYPATFKAKNQGLVQADTDYAHQVSMKDYQYIVKKFENDAAFYLNRLTDYLHAHTTTYKEYNKHVDGKLDARNNTYKTGFYLGKGGCCCGLRNDKPEE